MAAIGIKACVHPGQGYGQIVIHLCRELIKMNHQPHVVADTTDYSCAPVPPELPLVAGLRPNVPCLVIAPPGHAPDTRRPNVVMYTMWETPVLRKEWVRRLNNCAAVIVPSIFCYNAFEANGVTAPLYCVPLGVDPTQFFVEERDEHGPARFGTCANTSTRGSERKNIDAIIAAWLFAAPEDAILEIKTNPASVIDSSQFDPRIIVIKERWSDLETAAWFRSLDVYVAASSAEAFGLCELQAIACGAHVIAPRWGGPTDFLARSPEAWTPLNGHITHARGIYTGLGSWFEPNFEDLGLQMTNLAMQRPHRGRLAAHRTRLAMPWLRTAVSIINVLDDHGLWGKEIALDKNAYATVATPTHPCQLDNSITVVGPQSTGCGVGLYARLTADMLDAHYAPYNSTVTSKNVLYHFHRHYYEHENGFSELQTLHNRGHHITLDVHDPENLDDVRHLAKHCIFHTSAFFIDGTHRRDNATIIPMSAPSIVPLPLLPDTYRNTIAWHGLWSPHKGVVELIDAFAQLHHKEYNGKLLLAGAVHDISRDARKDSTQYIDLCKHHIAQANLPDEYVSMNVYDGQAPSHHELAHIFADTHIAVLPYQTNNAGQSSAAAFFAGLRVPLITTPSGMFFDCVNYACYTKGFTAKDIHDAIEETEHAYHIANYRAEQEYERRKYSTVRDSYRLLLHPSRQIQTTY